jgi:hypothetical protein
MKMCAAVLPLLLIGAVTAVAQVSPDPQILAEVNRIQAVDNHTHVMKVVGPMEKDDDFDALPCDPLEASETPFLASPENPNFSKLGRSCMDTSTMTANRSMCAN